MKLKNLINGTIIEVHPSTKHPNSSYGQPVWVDKNNNDYGQVGLPLLGYELVFQFTEPQYHEFKIFLTKLQGTNRGLWPATETWPLYEGMPGYTVSRYEQENGKIFIMVKFDTDISLPENVNYGNTGRRFKMGGDYGYKPVCDHF